MDKININALFLGPKSENASFFKEMLNFLVEDHLSWRKYFHPDDENLTDEDEKELITKADTLQKTREALLELAAILQTNSVPWFSPRYLGHMNSDTIMAALLGNMLTLLYNPNNCAYEASSATTPMEIEVGKQLAVMCGFNYDSAWGHITSGGTVANYESLWIARNMKSLPFAIKKIMPELIDRYSDWELQNLSYKTTLDLLEKTKAQNKFDEVRNATTRGTGTKPALLGKWLVPQSKHYSWVKAVDILGIGQENLEIVKVDEYYRLDIDDLKQKIDNLIKNKIPVLGVVGVVGSTEEGAVDEIDKIIALRNDYEKDNIWFHIHIDAAYGGYIRSVFLDEDGKFISNEEAKKIIDNEKLYKSYQAFKDVDSITLDPHKLGYIPYSAGAILFSDRRVLDIISYFAAYVFEKEEKNPVLLGSYIMEGSKAGAVVASVWTAHKVVPLNIAGYGKLLKNSIEGAKRFYHSIKENSCFDIIITDDKGQDINKKINVFCLTEPDLNILIYSFNTEGNKCLKKMNELNQKIYEKFSYRSGPVYANDYLMSKTSLSFEEYSDIPVIFLEKFEIPFSEWETNQEVFVLRSCILTHLLVSNKYQLYWDTFFTSLKQRLTEIFNENKHLL